MNTKWHSCLGGGLHFPITSVVLNFRYSFAFQNDDTFRFLPHIHRSNNRCVDNTPGDEPPPVDVHTPDL